MNLFQPTHSTPRALLYCLVAALVCSSPAQAQTAEVESKLKGFDVYMEQLLRDWNAPGVGVGIVINDKLWKMGGRLRSSRSIPRASTFISAATEMGLEGNSRKAG